MQLHHKILGKGEPLLILHGLFGSSDNWQTLGRRFAEKNTVFLIDLRNHGRSPHLPTHTYPELAEDLEQFLDEHYIHTCSVLGHSMGGKAAMQTALFYPERIEQLVVVDMAPRAYSGGHEQIFMAMRSLDLEHLDSRKVAEQELMEQISDKGIVQFLMKNLSRKSEGGFEWKPNLEILYRDYGAILAEMEDSGTPFPGRALFLKGERSNYVTPEDDNDIKLLFPKARISSIPSAGHWIHAEQPDLLFEEVRSFLDGSDGP